MKAWKEFKGGKWETTIDVRDFTDRNYTEYFGDSSFLEGPTESSLELNKRFHQFLEEENERLKLQIKDLSDSMCVMSENEFKLTDMETKFMELEKEWLNQKDIIESLHNEIDRINRINLGVLGAINSTRKNQSI